MCRVGFGTLWWPGINVEDILVCDKAFLVALEDPIIRLHQKGKKFKTKMHELYSDLVKAQAAADQALLSCSSMVTQEEYVKHGVGMITIQW